MAGLESREESLIGIPEKRAPFPCFPTAEMPQASQIHTIIEMPSRTVAWI